MSALIHHQPPHPMRKEYVSPKEFMEINGAPLSFIWDHFVLKLESEELEAASAAPHYVHSFQYCPHTDQYLFQFTRDHREATVLPQDYAAELVKQLSLHHLNFTAVPVKSFPLYQKGYDGSLN